MSVSHMDALKEGAHQPVPMRVVGVVPGRACV
jgi:DNA-binding winged helix-turn-helix (wHTH) protein